MDADRTMVSEFASAYVAAVPMEQPEVCLLPAAGAAWRLHTDLSASVASLRSLILQALDPLAMAGVAQHSRWREDMFGRLSSTSRYVNTLLFGSRDTAESAAARVRRLHSQVHGVDTVTGKPYDATSSDLLLWVHVAMVDSFISAHRAFGEPIDATVYDAYCVEMVEFASVVGIDVDSVPRSAAATTAWIEARVPVLCGSPIASEAVGLLLAPAGIDDETSELWRDVGGAAVATLPPWACAMHGWAPPTLTPDYAHRVRQLLGALDFSVEMEPGVVDARQRIERWARAATSA